MHRIFKRTITSDIYPGQRLVVGCGSNVVDKIHKVQAVPKVGEKGFFLSPTKTLETSIVGGVTLNHLAWASILGVPTGLLALQGTDASGVLIRDTLKKLNINSGYVKVKEKFTSAESYVFLQEDGERSIVMASGATSMINDIAVNKYFGKAIQDAAMATTEISQVPLSGVIELLKKAKEANILSLVDLDVSPTVAFKEAKLGSMDELDRALCMADIIKPTLHAAEEFLQLKRPSLTKKLDPRDVVQYLLEITDAKMVAITNGAKDSIIGTQTNIVNVPVTKLDKVIDATGAGDAFCGGLIAGLHFDGFPTTEDDLWNLGQLCNKTGASNCLVLGALPNENSIKRMQNEIERFRSKSGSHDANVFRKEIKTIEAFRESLNRDFGAVQEIYRTIDSNDIVKFVDALEKCTGNILTSGIGKSGIVASRFAASLSSIGIPAHYVHATEWSHGDLGKIHNNDIIIFISHSGNTQELIRALELVERKNVLVLAILGTEVSKIGKSCDGCIRYNVKNLKEPLGGIPTTSIILQDAIINGLMCTLIEQRHVTRDDFLTNHPGGSLGVKFSKK